MNTRILILALFLVSLGAGGCLSTVSEGPETAVDHFGLESSSLGAAGGRFAVTSISVNQDLVFVFNDLVDPDTVNLTSISITSLENGSTPPGSFVVDGKKVIFRPTIFPCNSGLGYGFRDGSTYEVYLQRPAFAGAPAPNAVHSLAGRPNETQIEGSITAVGVADLSPGSPTAAIGGLVVEDSSERFLSIPVHFNDVMQPCQLADPITGESGFLSVPLIDSEGWVVVVLGTWDIEVDRDNHTTTATFTSSTAVPGNGASDEEGEPTRQLRLDLDARIADVTGNYLSNAGAFFLELPFLPRRFVQTSEAFLDASAFDPERSTAGLWFAGRAGVDTGQDPILGDHHGGGHGALGSFVSDGDFTFDTDSHQFESPFLSTVVTVQGGGFQFSDFYLGVEDVFYGQGANPLRLITAGEFLVDGLIDVRGADAAVNIGKYRPTAEAAVDEPETNMHETYAQGGRPGIGHLAAGSGGAGGEAWYYGRADGFSYDPDKEKKYYYVNLIGWAAEETGGATAQSNRFNEDLSTDEVHGRNGGPVGGGDSLGSPIDDPELIHENFFVSDGQGGFLPNGNGAGMGTLAWPAFGCMIHPILGERVKTHDTGEIWKYWEFAIHRSRGGGGASYWTDGERGEYFKDGAINPLGEDLVSQNQVTTINTAEKVYEFNGNGTGADLLALTFMAPPALPSIEDGAPGSYLVPIGQESLDPEDGFLLGGAGGGGAGNGEHGSYSLTPRLGDSEGVIDTFRSCDGGGGGAGGGAIKLHSGSSLIHKGVVDARGGNGGSSAFMQSVPYADAQAILMTPPGDAGGGGGSGGAVLIQAPIVDLDPGSILLAGGSGGHGSVGNSGGKGGAGVLHIDLPGPVDPSNPPPGFGMLDLAFVVEPDESIDLAKTGQHAGDPNLGSFDGELGLAGESIGDISVDGMLFNGNSSSVQSLWLSGFPNDLTTGTPIGWSVEYEYSNDFDSGVVSKTYSHDDYEIFGADILAPGVSPFWIAFQGGYAPIGSDVTANPELVYNFTEWSIPGRHGEHDLNAFRKRVLLAWRFRIGFDHDLIRQNVFGATPGPNAYLRVTKVELQWTCD